jgi:hypothetical protein
MSGFGFDIEMKNILADFDNLATEIQDKIVDELRTTGFEIETTYKINVPLITARLKSSIHTEHSDFTRFAYTDKFGNRYDGTFFEKPANRKQVIIGSNVVYAPIIEIKGGKTMGKDALQNAFDMHTKGLPERILKLIE